MYLFQRLIAYILNNFTFNVDIFYISGEQMLHFLVMITGCGSVGKLHNCEIYRITNVAMISLRGYQPGR